MPFVLSKIVIPNVNPAWTKNIRFESAGLEYRPSGLIGRKDWVQIPYKDVSGFHLMEGTFYLFSHGSKKSVFEQLVSTPNFFPGLFLLGQLKRMGFPPVEKIEIEGEA